MSQSFDQNENNNRSRKHEPGAWAAWGMIAGGALGVLSSLIVDRAWIGMIVLAVIGWTVGGLIDRSKM